MEDRRVWAGVLLALALPACSPAPQTTLTDAQRAAIERAVEARVSGYGDALRRKDLNWFLGFWADDSAFVLAGDGNIVGPAAWREQVRQSVENTHQLLQFEFFNRHTYVLAPNAAVLTTQFRWAILRAPGDTLRMHGSWSYVLENFGGTWRVIHSAGTHLPG